MILRSEFVGTLLGAKAVAVFLGRGGETVKALKASLQRLADQHLPEKPQQPEQHRGGPKGGLLRVWLDVETEKKDLPAGPERAKSGRVKLTLKGRLGDEIISAMDVDALLAALRVLCQEAVDDAAARASAALQAREMVRASVLRKGEE